MYALTDLPEINQVEAGGFSVCLHNENNQNYLEVMSFPTGEAWNKKAVSILILVPPTYHLGASLDGFYMESGVLLIGGQRHPRTTAECSILNRTWWQASWHYPDHKKWVHKKDNLLTHIHHCGVFFKQGSQSN